MMYYILYALLSIAGYLLVLDKSDASIGRTFVKYTLLFFFCSCTAQYLVDTWNQAPTNKQLTEQAFKP